MTPDANVGIYFWGFLILYGVLMYALSPSAVTVSSFFRGTDESGRATSTWMLTARIFISWIFAKSVTNAANLGASYGIVTRIGCSPAPAGRAIYGSRIEDVHVDALRLDYDQAAWVRQFLANWPRGSPAHASYFRRIMSGPAFALEQALGARNLERRASGD